MYLCENFYEMIIVTGAAGFIASALVAKLNELRYFDLVLVDDFSRSDRQVNYIEKKFRLLLDRKELFSFIEKNENQIDFIFHLGARTDTTEFDKRIFDELNLSYSQKVWELCTQYAIPMVYASSAATYGDGAFGYEDDHQIIPKLKPLNPYGDSKNDFDKWVITQTHAPFFWAGLKFFNVYGPNEYHKGRMASVVWHAFNQIQSKGEMKLFRSHHPDYTDGGQMRDFIYVKDVADVCIWLMENRKQSGIFNLGSGKARTFLDLVRNTFQNMGLPEKISFIDTPEDIRDKYQYFTEANMSKLINAGYSAPFHTLEEGVKDYVGQYLNRNKKIY
jgi:ADP-L-glycero-D-manno-heptose 6-epimerase